MTATALEPQPGGGASLPTRQSEICRHCVFATSTIGMAICTPTGRVLESNAALERMLGAGIADVLSLHAREIAADGSNSHRSQWEDLLAGKQDSYEVENRFRSAGGSMMWGRLRVTLVRNRTGDPSFMTATLEDISASRRAEEKLRESEKLEVIGRLAGSIAHDFNNLLTGMLLYSDLLLSGLDPGDRMRAHVEEIRLAAEQGAALTQQLLAIARKQVCKPRPTQLNAVIASAANLLRRLIGEPIKLRTELAPGLGPILADPAQLRQILLNLVLNARDAMPEGGTITIRTAAALHPATGQPAVSLVVADSGCGMDEQTRSRLFEPFFTTKPDGRGTGLGLATVHRIVTESGGAIEVTSEVGRGTAMEVFLPETAETADIPAAPGRDFSAQGRLPC